MIIDIDNVSWIRDGKKIIKNINWKVQSGEHWAIVGLNGSGKTTLLNMINGYIFPSTGKMSVLGKEFGRYDLRELRKSIGWVSSSLQEQLYINEKVEEIVLSGKFATIGLYHKPNEEEIEQVHNLLEQLKCIHLVNRLFKTLSQGEKQKILIVRALISNPKLLILDEPCNGLDIFAREQLLSTIEEIGNEPAAPTLLYVSHHIEEILPIFNYTLLIRKGEIHSTGKTCKVVTGDNLSQFFEAPVDVVIRNERVWMNVITQN